MKIHCSIIYLRSFAAKSSGFGTNCIVESCGRLMNLKARAKCIFRVTTRARYVGDVSRLWMLSWSPWSLHARCHAASTMSNQRLKHPCLTHTSAGPHAYFSLQACGQLAYLLIKLRLISEDHARSWPDVAFRQHTCRWAAPLAYRRKWGASSWHSCINQILRLRSSAQSRKSWGWSVPTTRGAILWAHYSLDTFLHAGPLNIRRARALPLLILEEGIQRRHTAQACWGSVVSRKLLAWWINCSGWGISCSKSFVSSWL